MSATQPVCAERTNRKQHHGEKADEAHEGRQGQEVLMPKARVIIDSRRLPKPDPDNPFKEDWR